MAAKTPILVRMQLSCRLGGVALVLAVLCACSPSRRDEAPARATSVSDTTEARSGRERPGALVLGLTPFLEAKDMRSEFAPLARYLESEVHVPVELRLAASYAALSQMMASREVHLAVFSPFAYVRARRENPDMILLATQISDGSPTYAAYIIARNDGSVRDIEGLRGKRFAYVDQRSASGYIYPRAYLRSLGYDPDAFFGPTVLAGNHSRVTDMVLSGEGAAGATNATAFKMARLEKAQGNRLVILAKTGRIPLDAYCASPRLAPDLTGAIRQALLQLSTRSEDGRRVLRGLTAINGFVEVSDDHYEEVRRAERLSHGEPVAP